MNSRLPFIDVISITKDICEDYAREDCEIIHVPVKLLEDEELKEFVVVGVCKKESKEIIENILSLNNGRVRKDLVFPREYCHITTYESKDKRDKEISFDQKDNYPIKEEFSGDFEYIKYFFDSFILFRNNLIQKKEVVKRDDIYQYYLSVTGFAGHYRKRKK